MGSYVLPDAAGIHEVRSRRLTAQAYLVFPCDLPSEFNSPLLYSSRDERSGSFPIVESISGNKPLPQMGTSLDGLPSQSMCPPANSEST